MRTGGSESRSPKGNGTTRTQRPLARSIPAMLGGSIGKRVVATVFAMTSTSSESLMPSTISGRSFAYPRTGTAHRAQWIRGAHLVRR
ncbi:MAG: hypothetical protein AUH85_03395 [Chloroflexi bacterium 13_1_40CM_4_68_4]|nr:MAG: hypothetical protein AUH85_03395 [Chloroflexi bacterium 13_1_40CM_4_68_4]